MSFGTLGPRTPGTRTPGSSTPGPDNTAVETVELSGAAIDSTGVTSFQELAGGRARVVSVRIDPTAADVSFNVNLDGGAVFTAPQSPSAASPETFKPDDAEADSGAVSLVDLGFEVTSASATGGATADVSVDVEILD